MLDLLKTRRARGFGIPLQERTRPSKAETVLKIVIGIVENDERAVFNRRELRRNRGNHIGQFCARSFGICTIGRRILRIGFGKGLSNRGQHHPPVFRVKPDMRVHATFMIVVVVIVIGMVLMLILVIVMIVFRHVRACFSLYMLFKNRRIAEFQKGDPLRLDKLDLDRLGCERLKRLVQPRREHRPNPEHHIRRLQGSRLARAHAIAMRRNPLRNKERRCPHPLHHLRHKRLHRRDVGNDLWRLGHRGPRQTHRGHAAQYPSFHISLLDVSRFALDLDDML